MPAPELAARLAEELERPRPLPSQVVRYLTTTYELEPEALGTFLSDSLDSLEDYEIDLILSPIFTPAFSDQMLFAPLLGTEGLSPAALEALIEALAQRPTTARLVTDDGVTHPAKLRLVTIERYVRRLRLDGSVPEPISRQLASAVPEIDRALALAVARRATWNHPGRQALLGRYLEQVHAHGAWSATDLLSLLRLAETYEPDGLNDFLSRLPGWIESVRRDITSASSPKPFFNERVEDLHGGGRDHRRSNDKQAAQNQATLQSMQQLRQLLSE